MILCHSSISKGDKLNELGKGNNLLFLGMFEIILPLPDWPRGRSVPSSWNEMFHFYLCAFEHLELLKSDKYIATLLKNIPLSLGQ